MAERKSRTPLTMTYDPEADAVAIDLREPVGRILTRELGDDHYADFDSRGRLVGLEVLFASRHYDRAVLEQLKNPVEYLTLAEAAEESGLSPGTLRNQINAGRLPAIKRGRDWMVAGHELLNYLENRAPQGVRSAAERRARSRHRPSANQDLRKVG